MGLRQWEGAVMPADGVAETYGAEGGGGGGHFPVILGTSPPLHRPLGPLVSRTAGQ